MKAFSSTALLLLRLSNLFAQLCFVAEDLQRLDTTL